MTKLNLKRTKSTTNGQRHQINQIKASLVRNPGVVKNLFKKSTSYGRSTQFGKITCWHKQRGAKRLYRLLRDNVMMGLTVGICYDPNRSGLVSLNFDMENKRFFYSLCPTNGHVGMLTQGYEDVLPKQNVGNRSKIKFMTPGTILHNLGYKDKSCYVRAAGAQAVLVNNIDGNSKIKMPSGEVKNLSWDSYGTIGKVSNSSFYLRSIGKAGRNRHKGRRPIVRGIAMNPVDHPHGGRTNGGMPSVTPWGLPTKGGFKLRKKKI